MTLDAFWTQYHAWVVGGGVVAATAYGRFNTPPTSRSSTTWARYHVMACVYALALLASWIVLANTPDIIAVLVKDTDLSGRLASLETPLYAAVLLAVLPELSPVGAFDAKVRTFLQDLARIPWEAQRLSAALRARTWLPDAEFQADLRRSLRAAGFSDVDLSFSCEGTPQALWTRISALQAWIARWETRPGKFAGFYFANVAAVGALREEYDALAAKARRVFPILAAARRTGGDGALDPAQHELAGAFVAAAERLEKQFCDLMSRGVLTCALTARARRAEFETVGFLVNATPSQLFDNMLGLYFCLAALYVVVMMVTGRPRPWLSGLVIASIYVGAVGMAFLLKRSSWAASLPIARYASSAGAAFGFAFCTSVGLGILTTFDVREALVLQTTRWWPWGLMSAAVATLVAYRIDQDEQPGIAWREAGLLSAVCALFAVPVVLLLHQACACDQPPLLRVMCTAGTTGGLIGYFVPTWYRRPEVMVSGYERFRIIVTARTTADGVVATTIDVIPPKTPGVAKPVPVRLPDEIEDASRDDALADAVRTARGWIEAHRPSGPDVDRPLQMAGVCESLSGPGSG